MLELQVRPISSYVMARRSIEIGTQCAYRSIAYLSYGRGKDIEISGGHMQLMSPAFKDGEVIPLDYSCNGDDISPPLIWNSIPQDTDSLVLICEDPDAPNGTWSHWVLYNIPPSVAELEEEIPPVAMLDNGAIQGMNDFGDIAYGGPCPPSGEHRYFFRLYALDTMLDVEAGMSREDILNIIQPHILAEADLMGVYASIQEEI